MYFEDTIDEVKYCGHLFGLGSSLFTNGVPYDTTYIAPQTLVSVAQSVAASLHSHNSSQASLAGGQNGNNQSSSNLVANSSSASLNGADSSTLLIFICLSFG